MREARENRYIQKQKLIISLQLPITINGSAKKNEGVEEEEEEEEEEAAEEEEKGGKKEEIAELIKKKF